LFSKHLVRKFTASVSRIWNSLSPDLIKTAQSYLAWTDWVFLQSFSTPQHYIMHNERTIYAIAVRPSVTRVNQSKTVEDRIIQFSPHATSFYFCRIRLIPKF